MENSYPDITLDRFPEAVSLILGSIEGLKRELSDLKVAVAREDERILSPKEVCALFEPQISTRTLFNWSDQGLIRKHYLGGKTFYKKSEILESLDKLKKYQIGKRA